MIPQQDQNPQLISNLQNSPQGILPIQQNQPTNIPIQNYERNLIENPALFPPQNNMNSNF